MKQISDFEYSWKISRKDACKGVLGGLILKKEEMIMRKVKKVLCFVMLVTMLSLTVAGCQPQTTDEGGAAENNVTVDGDATTDAEDSVTADEDSSDADADVGVRGDVSFDVWAPLHWVGAVMHWDESVAWQEIQARTGVNLNFIHPPAGQEQENFNLLIVSDNLPDMIVSHWGGNDMWIGGFDRYINDGVILRLNELIEEYAPNYLHAIRTFVPEDQQRDFVTDEGNMAAFFAISPYEEWSHNGIQYRKDWLDELGLENPETFDEIEYVLTQFRDVMGATSPLIFPQSGIDGWSGLFMSAWDIGPAFYRVDNVVKYGPARPEFAEYLALLADWYAKGLIDRDFATRDNEAQHRLITTGEAGAIIHSPDTVGDWMADITIMVAGYYPVRSHGDQINFRLQNFALRPPFSFTITTACEQPEEAARFLDFGYTQEGWMIYNYGIEGLTYNLTGETFEINGYIFEHIEYTDVMLDNPPLSILDTIAKYKVHIGPFLRFEHEGNPTVNWNTAGMRQFWTEAAGTSLNMPMISMNAEEGQEFARIMNQVHTYRDTAILEFIMGIRSLDTFDEYLSNLERLGINEAIAIQQAALDRYNER